MPRPNNSYPTPLPEPIAEQYPSLPIDDWYRDLTYDLNNDDDFLDMVTTLACEHPSISETDLEQLHAGEFNPDSTEAIFLEGEWDRAFNRAVQIVVVGFYQIVYGYTGKRIG